MESQQPQWRQNSTLLEAYFVGAGTVFGRLPSIKRRGCRQFQTLYNFLPCFNLRMTFLCRQSFQVVHNNICHFLCDFSSR